MPRLINHTLYPLDEYLDHSPDKHQDFRLNGGRYALRAYALTTPEDTIQVNPALGLELAYLQDHFAAAGLRPTQQVMLSTAREEALSYPDHDLSVYMFDNGFHAIRPDARRLSAVERLGDKNYFVQWCIERGHPVPHTVIVEPGVKPDYSDLHFPAIVKPTQTSNGKGMVTVNSRAELTLATKMVGSRYQVQEKVPDVVASVSIQYDMANGQAAHLATTEQIVHADFSHGGNVYPTEYNPQSATDPLAADAAAEGLEGICGFDVVITGSGKTYIIENNPRFTGASYVTLAAQKLAIPSWAAYKLPTSHNSPEMLGDLEGLAYDKASKIGVIIMNNALLAIEGQQSKVEVLIAGTPDDQAAIETDLRQVLNPQHRPLHLPAAMLAAANR